MTLIFLSVFLGLALGMFSSKRKYAADDQSLQMLDILDEARQSALNQRRTFRVEINRTKKQIILINENSGGSASDDRIVRSVNFKEFVSVGDVPNNILASPTATSPIPVLDFARSEYPLSNGDEKITMRFSRDGLVMDTGTDNIGTGDVPRGATIYVFSNKQGTATPEIIRAITVLQTSGDASVLKCRFDSNGKCGNWQK